MKHVSRKMTSILAMVAAFGVLQGTEPAAASTNTGGQVLTFGIVPQQSASRLAKMWGPFLAELSAQTGVTFRFRTTKDIPTFEACLASGAFDVAYMNPMHYTIFSSEASYTAIAHQSEKRLKGVLVARADASFEDLEGLQGGTVAFPSPGAFGASILNRALLVENGVAFDPAYVKSHDSVYRAVAAGLMVAGGGVTRTFNSVDPEIRAQLQIIHETPGYTPHAIAVHGGVEPELRDNIQNALMTIAEVQPTLVKGIGMKGFVTAGDGDWDDVRSLQMSREDTGISRKGDAVCPSD